MLLQVLHFAAYLTAASLDCAKTEVFMGNFHAVVEGVLGHCADFLFSFFFPLFLFFVNRMQLATSRTSTVR